MGSPKATGFAKAVGAARPSERLLGLLRQHERLLGDVGRKRKAYQRAQEEVDRVAAEVSRRLQPIFEESRRLDAEVHALFAELLGGARLAKRARRAVARFYAELRRRGVLSAGQGPGAGGVPHPASPDFEEDFSHDDDRGASREGRGGPRSSHPRSAAAADVRPAPPVAASSTLRALFLRLARALHPDRVQDAREQAARTETMKELNRAYREGDFARLAELERLVTAQGGVTGWKGSRGPDPSRGRQDDDGDGPNIAERCAALEQTNQALRDQLSRLRRDLRALRDSEMGRLAADIERHRERGGKGDPFAALDADAAVEVQRFRAFRDHVRAFRDGSISLEDLLMGPLEGSDEDDAWNDEGSADFRDGPVGRRAGRARQASGPSKRGRRRRR